MSGTRAWFAIVVVVALGCGKGGTSGGARATGGDAAVAGRGAWIEPAAAAAFLDELLAVGGGRVS